MNNKIITVLNAKETNIRYYIDILHLIVLSDLEVLNSNMIEKSVLKLEENK